MPLVPMDNVPQGLENLKLLYGLGVPASPVATMDPGDGGTGVPQGLAPGASEPVIAISGGEETQYTEAYNHLISQGAGARFPKTMSYIKAQIDRHNWAEAGSNIGSVYAWMATPAKESSASKMTMPPVGVPPPVAGQKKAVSPWLLLGGAALVGLAGLMVVKSVNKKE